jgi:16S rRNA (uracil1498-N3)-methyltransferase
MIRLYITEALAEGAEIAPEREQAHYLLHVMRLQAGQDLLLFNGCDGEWRARVAEASKRSLTLEVEARTRAQETPPDLELLAALVKRSRIETIVEKAAELGARRVRLLITRRTNADHANVARLQAIAAEASEQTGRLDVPDVVAPEKLERVLDGWDASRRLMFCDEGGDARPILELDQRGPWAVLIGPEGGFAPEERERLRAEAFVTPVTLGPRILRADTAAIAALALWQARLGDWPGSAS